MSALGWSRARVHQEQRESLLKKSQPHIIRSRIPTTHYTLYYKILKTHSLTSSARAGVSTLLTFGVPCGRVHAATVKEAEHGSPVVSLAHEVCVGVRVGHEATQESRQMILMVAVMLSTLKMFDERLLMMKMLFFSMV